MSRNSTTETIFLCLSMFSGSELTYVTDATETCPPKKNGDLLCFEEAVLSCLIRGANG